MYMIAFNVNLIIIKFLSIVITTTDIIVVVVFSVNTGPAPWLFQSVVEKSE